MKTVHCFKTVMITVGSCLVMRGWAQAEVVDITKLVRDQSIAVAITGTVSNAS